jgi:hypothetical protein
VGSDQDASRLVCSSLGCPNFIASSTRDRSDRISPEHAPLRDVAHQDQEQEVVQIAVRIVIDAEIVVVEHKED